MVPTESFTKESKLILAPMESIRTTEVGERCSFCDFLGGDSWKCDELGREIVSIALPAVLALAADPITSLVDSAFVGHLGMTINVRRK